jgi:hypothetical protein
VLQKAQNVTNMQVAAVCRCRAYRRVKMLRRALNWIWRPKVDPSREKNCNWLFPGMICFQNQPTNKTRRADCFQEQNTIHFIKWAAKCKPCRSLSPPAGARSLEQPTEAKMESVSGRELERQLWLLEQSSPTRPWRGVKRAYCMRSPRSTVPSRGPRRGGGIPSLTALFRHGSMRSPSHQPASFRIPRCRALLIGRHRPTEKTTWIGGHSRRTWKEKDGAPRTPLTWIERHGREHDIWQGLGHACVTRAHGSALLC